MLPALLLSALRMSDTIRSHPLSLFSRSAVHRDLHSFPTRRSSDLYWLAEHHSTPALAGPAPEVLIPQVAAVTSGIRRSEEHTSELQSPCNLVCRLLLEKKKKDKRARDAH